MPSEFTIQVKVNPILKEFYHGYCNSRLVLEKKSLFLDIVASLLKVRPKGILPSNYDKSESIEIVLPYLSHRGIDIEYRNYIDDEGMEILLFELNKFFKNKLHDFVSGFIAGCSDRFPYNTYGTMKKAIDKFGEMYNLPFEFINFETLKKSFDRSVEKKILKKVL